jgi:DNA mismatch endonuclease (patch repair protein)
VFWREKIQGNRRRDRKVNAALRRKGWEVVRIWECQVESRATVEKISRGLCQGPRRMRHRLNSTDQLSRARKYSG